ncbi:MAG: D-sedoheptulose 7-phosphate isomerase [Bacteroidales bacterium]|jgi:D-sedoheptulose 7-phosphate isomerase|nr:D-sedoheptulose 7-phosphate isomerase [Bacteroidales bacterium]
MRIQQAIEDSIKVKKELLLNPKVTENIEKAIDIVVNCYKQAGKVLFCGNGGSAADSQHLAAELSGRFYYDRPPLDAEALHVNTSYVTAVANDYSYDVIFSRMIQAQGHKGDVLFGLSTSGNSKNVVLAMEQAKEKGMKIIALTGQGGGKMKELSDVLLDVPSKDTPRIQECHIMIGHIICEMVEKTIFPKE